MEESLEKQRREFEKQRRIYGNPGNLKIKGFIPLDERLPINKGRRYTKPYDFKLTCPQCGEVENVYENNWPPNYSSGGSGFTGPDGVAVWITAAHEAKYICIECRIQFNVLKSSKTVSTYKNNIIICRKHEESQEIKRVKSLVLLHNWYLTESDVAEEKFYDEHGHYPFVIYG